MSYSMTDMNTVVRELAGEIREQTESLILEQLNDLVSRDLLELEIGHPTLVQDPMHRKLQIRQTVKLTLKDKEYIQQLEAENKRLKELMDAIKASIPGIA